MHVLNDMLETALWSTLDYDTENEYLDNKYCISDIDDDFKTECQNIIDDFMEKATPYFTDDELENSPIGHDLWLTIERHGAGFWDGDYENGDKLTELCRSYKEMSDKLNESIKR